uniref:CD55 molecule (Cromer blood group) n=1 Tax=Mandrillus leucophaeus TaxID=9568 RepID=A0A2K5XLS3_MANLE
MTVARPSVPAALPLLGELPRLLLLLLLLCLPAVWADCGPPPAVPNAQPALKGLTSFPENTIITYRCDENFTKIPGKHDSVMCLQDSQWSDIEEFCNQKSCPNPGEIPNGQIDISNGILFGAAISFSCNTGYKLFGPTSSLCLASDSGVQWSDTLPECREIYCPAPPQIDNGIIQGEREHYGYRQSITYLCNRGFTMIGEHSIYCTVNDDEGEWSGPPPACRANSLVSKAPPTVQKPTTVNVRTTEVSPTSQKTTTPNAQATRSTPASRTTKHFHKTTPDKESGTSSGTTHLLSGYTCFTLTGLLGTLVTMGWLT